MKTRLLLTFFILFLIVVTFYTPLDIQAKKLLDDALMRAFSAFGLAKALNAAISMLQGTELSLMPAGVGVTLSIGEVLDPFNDMVERFSWVMLLASVSLGIQKILLAFGGKLFLKITVTLFGLAALAMLWSNKKHAFVLALKGFLFLLLLRFFAVIYLYASQFVYTALLQQEYIQAMQKIEMTKSHIEEFEKRSEMESKKEESSITQYFSDKYEQLKDTLDLKAKFKELERSIDASYTSIVDLITLFVVESILFPLLFLWIFILLLKALFRVNIAHLKKNTLFSSFF